MVIALQVVTLAGVAVVILLLLKLLSQPTPTPGAAVRLNLSHGPITEQEK